MAKANKVCCKHRNSSWTELMRWVTFKVYEFTWFLGYLNVDILAFDVQCFVAHDDHICRLQYWHGRHVISLLGLFVYSDTTNSFQNN